MKIQKILICVLAFLLVVSVPQDGMSQKRRTTTTTKTTSKKKATSSRKSSSRYKKKSSTKKSSSKTNEKLNVEETDEIKGLKSEKAKLQRDIAQQEGELRSTKADVGKRLKNLIVLNGEIDAREKHIVQLQHDIDTINNHITGLTHNLDSLQRQLQDHKAKYTRSLRKMQRQQGNRNNLNFILSSKSFNEMYRRIRYLKEYAAYQRMKGEAVKKEQGVVDEQKKHLERTKEERNILLKKDEDEKSTLQVKKGEQQKVVKSLQNKQKEIQVVLTEQRKKNAQLNKKIDQLIAIEVEKAHKRAAEEAKRRAAELAAKKKAAEEAAARRRAAEEEARRRAAEADVARRNADAIARSTQDATKRAEAEADARRAIAAAEKAEAIAEKARATEASASSFKLNTNDTKITGSFEHNRGRLPMPITGSYRIVSHFGQYNVEGLKNVTLDNKGINIQGQAGAHARSIYEGEVSAVFSFDGTIVVMVRHGDYISVYCNLASVSVSRGQHVSTRQVLGTLGADHILQFQLRKGTAKLNPETWVR